MVLVVLSIVPKHNHECRTYACTTLVSAVQTPTFGIHRWCAMTMGLPLEAPKEATRGWDIPTLRAGLQGLAPQHAPKLGLFCRCLCCLLSHISTG